jgi:flagellar protein FliS
MSLMTAQLSQYNRTAILSASPAQLLTMLYDRLLLDLARAEAAQTSENWRAASEQLLHAQAIIAELQSSLKVDEWDGGPGLFALYTYINTAIIKSNINRNVYLTTECIGLIEPLRQAWVDAADQLAAAPQQVAARGWGIG